MRAVLFDLDGTLLDLDLDAFLVAYFGALRAVSEREFPGADVMAGVMEGTRAMMADHPGSTNQQAFAARFEEVCRVELERAWPVFDRFYEEDFPLLGAALGPMRGARTAVEKALEMGLEVAIATNPIFPRRAIEHRLDWAGLGDLPLATVTTYEVMHACKPWPAYFTETAGLVGADPRECMMVGDDRTLDLAAADVGMTTFYVGGHPSAAADYRGDLESLAGLLPRLADSD